MTNIANEFVETETIENYYSVKTNDFTIVGDLDTEKIYFYLHRNNEYYPENIKRLGEKIIRFSKEFEKKRREHLNNTNKEVEYHA